MIKMDFEEYMDEHLDGLDDELDPNDPNQCELPEVSLCFVRLIGEESDGFYRYEFIFTDNPDECWGDNWDEKPAGLVNDLYPSEEYVTEVHILKTKIKFDLAQDNCCFSFQDCVDNVCSLCYESLDTYTEYPQDGRLVFMFGESFGRVEEKLAMKHLLFVN
jgi:hypothetical protein